MKNRRGFLSTGGLQLSRLQPYAPMNPYLNKERGWNSCPLAHAGEVFGSKKKEALRARLASLWLERL
jgi:hypothetical protein